MRRIQALVARLELDHLGRDLSLIPVSLSSIAYVNYYFLASDIA